jgi:hypothetical protein
MKKFFAGMAFLILLAINMNAQNITWNITGADPSQYKSISRDELWDMFENNQLAGNQKYKVIQITGYLTETATAISLLALFASASGDTELSSKHLYFKGLPRIEARNREIEVYFSQGVIFEDLENDSNISVKIPIIAVDGYRVL